MSYKCTTSNDFNLAIENKGEFVGKKLVLAYDLLKNVLAFGFRT
jgi:hypothetical protein